MEFLRRSGRKYRVSHAGEVEKQGNEASSPHKNAAKLSVAPLAAKKHPAVDVSHDSQVEINELEDAFTYKVDMPGVQLSDINIEEHLGVLSVEANRKQADHMTHRFAKHFLLKESILDVEEGMQAVLSDGVLTIMIPKKKEAKPITLDVSPTEPPKEREDGNEFRHTFDLPGVRPCDVVLQIGYGKVRIHASRERGSKLSTIDKDFQVDCARVEDNAFSAYMKDGVLTLIGIRKQQPAARKIHVKDDDTPSYDELIA